VRVSISDQELDEINSLLPWHAGAPLPDGRLLGRLGTVPGKRLRPDRIPDKRIVRLDRVLPLAKLSILEVGCFEGIHTLGLRMFAGDVTAIDVRPVNVVKTLARLACHGVSAKVFQQDVERLDASFGRFDLVFHCGVLYHLRNPVAHMMVLRHMCTHLFLDTHVARDERRIKTIKCEGKSYYGAYHHEGGWNDPFSGRNDTSFWLTLASLEQLLHEGGFSIREMWELREERGGPRISLLATRAGASEAAQPAAGARTREPPPGARSSAAEPAPAARREEDRGA
jgi:tRNA (mo5U34)-methyltransferase